MKITFNYYYEGEKIISVERQVNENDNLRDIFLEIYKKACKKGVKNWYKYKSKNSIPFCFDIYNDEQNVSPSGIGSLVNIKYKLNEDGTIRLLKGYDALLLDYKISELLAFKNDGIIKESFNRIDFSVPVGLGAGPGIDEIATFVGIMIEIVSKLREKYKRDKKQKELFDFEINKLLCQLKNKNNIENIIELRELFDDVKNWTTDKCKRLLGITEEQSNFCFIALGYELKENKWILTNSERAKENRKFWDKQEKIYLKFKDKYYY